MGCWNGTDGFGGLSIEAGDKIKVVIIQNAVNIPEASGFCYLNGISEPISFPINGTYDDYGSIENIEENVSSEMLIDFFDKELKNGNIKVIPDSKSSWTFEDESCITSMNDISLKDFLDIIERDRVFRIKENFDSQKKHYTNIGLMMFSNTIYNSILEINPLLSIKKDVSYFVEDVFYTLKSKESKSMIDKVKKDIFLYPKYWSEKSRSVNNGYNSVSIFDSFDFVNRSVFKKHYLFLKKGSFNSSELETLLFDMLSIISFMNALRRSWTPLTGKGGQDHNTNVFKGLANGINKQIKEEYLSFLDEEVMCYKNYGELKEGESFRVFKVEDDKITILSEGNEEKYILSFSEFDKCFR